MLLEIHHDCDEAVCCPKRRGLQCVAPEVHSYPPPICHVPDDRISAAVTRYTRAQSTLHAARESLHTQHQDSNQRMLTAIADFAAARRRRDALFLRALPDDDTIPVATITKFGITYAEVYRLVRGLGSAKATWISAVDE